MLDHFSLHVFMSDKRLLRQKDIDIEHSDYL